MNWTFASIGVVHSPCTEKFAVPRQPGLAASLNGRIEIFKPYDREEAFVGLDGFSHIWVIGVFHLSLREQWQPSVRPPRLGGNQRVGVFASRAPYRPNPIALSVFRYHGLQREQDRLFLAVSGTDLVDQTPVLDIKPYVPYADQLASAAGGYTEQIDKTTLQVEFNEQAQRQCVAIQREHGLDLATLIEELVRLDPRPAYRNDPVSSGYGMSLAGYNVRFEVCGTLARILSVDHPG